MGWRLEKETLLLTKYTRRAIRENFCHTIRRPWLNCTHIPITLDWGNTIYGQQSPGAESRTEATAAATHETYEVTSTSTAIVYKASWHGDAMKLFSHCTADQSLYQLDPARHVYARRNDCAREVYPLAHSTGANYRHVTYI